MMLSGEDRAWTFCFFLPSPHLSSPGSHSKSPQFPISSLFLVWESLVGVRAICCCLIKLPSFVARNSNCLLMNLQVWSGLGEGAHTPSLGVVWRLQVTLARAEGPLRCPASAAGGGWDPHYRHQPEYSHVVSVWPPDFLMEWWQGSKGML